MIGCTRAFVQELLVRGLTKILYSGVYCKIHRLRLIHLRYIDNNGDFIEVGYCSKCYKEYCEYKDISPIYISSYEWLYGDNND